MDQAEGIFRWIGNAGLVYCAIIGTASVVIHCRVPWRASRMGRHLMAYMFAMAIVLDLGVVRLVFGDSWWFALLRLVVFLTAIPLVMTWRLVLQVQAQRGGRELLAPRPEHGQPS